ncbi:hypothetical protein ABVK25_006464 [Lepraria finkii]|uniref:Uncharacterized protein n=1 Tax=Lepraria finkii TaxID=1340010 RepID=A0ABR4B5U4_9LECA
MSIKNGSIEIKPLTVPLRSSTKIILDVKQGSETLEEGEAPVSAQAKIKRKRDALGKGGVD